MAVSPQVIGEGWRRSRWPLEWVRQRQPRPGVHLGEHRMSRQPPANNTSAAWRNAGYIDNRDRGGNASNSYSPTSSQARGPGGLLPPATRLSAARISKKIAPGQPGSGRWQQRFGADLVCVRYRDDMATGRRVVTVEIQVEQRRLPLRLCYAPDDIVQIRIAFDEAQVRGVAIAVGGRWDQHTKTWFMSFAQALRAGLEDRIQHAE
jgi:hypothetical protein